MIESLMVQQQVESKWQHMVGVICLNLTHRKQVKELLPKLFKRYPNPKSYLRGRLKTQQEMHENNTKWNKVVEKIKQINFKKYKTNQTIGFIIDDIVKGEFINEVKQEKESTWAKEIDTSDMRDWDKPNESEVL